MWPSIFPKALFLVFLGEAASASAPADEALHLAAAAGADDECSSGDGAPCAANLLQRRAHRSAAAETAGGLEVEGAGADGGAACPAENTVCPAGLFLCLDGAVNGCFSTYGGPQARACTAFASVPCAPQGQAPAHARALSAGGALCPSESVKYKCAQPGAFMCIKGPLANTCVDGQPRVDPARCTGFATAPCEDAGGSASAAPPRPSGTSAVAPPAAAVQTSRLRVTNGCTSEPMWIAHMEGAKSVADPQNIMIHPQQSYDFHIPDGLESTRYWPKLGCDATGADCRIGDSGGPGQACDPVHGCAPPVDSKFEATFGTVGAVCDTAKGHIKGCDWLDISLVDGFTVPFKVEVIGHCEGVRDVDCSRLQLASCPTDLQLRHPGERSPSGCYSPCAKKTYPHWENAHGVHAPTDFEARMECCPTPPVSPKQCQAGPIAGHAYVQMVHQDCPGVYGYAYDDAQGLSVCPAGVKYHVTFFCPAG